MSKTYELSYTAEHIDELLGKVDEGTVYQDASTEKHGLMSATDKAKLDALPTAQQIEGSLSEKVDKVEGKGLSENDYTDDEKAKVASALQEETDPTVPSWAKQQNKPSYDYSEIGNTPDLSGFITKSVNDLTNYYLKSETYTKAEVAALIGAIQQFHYEIYATLPQSGESNVLYLIGPTGSGSDKYEEYVYANNAFTKIGDTSIDLSGYVTTSALNTALAGYTTTESLTMLLAGKQNTISDLEQIRTRANEGHTALQPKQSGQYVENNFVSFDANGGIKNSGCNESTFIKGVKQNGNPITPDANGMVDVTVQDGEDGLSAFEIAQQQGYTGTVEQWLASLKASIGEFKFITPTDTTAEAQLTTIGSTYASAIGGVSPTQSTLSIILLMNDSNNTKTMMIATQATSTAGVYEFVYTGDLQSAMPGNVLTEDRIVNDLTTGGVDDVLSAEQGKTLGDAVKDTIKGVSYNLFNKDADGFINRKYICSTGILIDSETSITSYLIPIKPDTVYTYAPYMTGVINYSMYIRFVANDGVTPLKPINPDTDEEINYASTWGRKTIKSPTSAKYIQFTIVYRDTDYRDTAQLVEGSELPTEYHAYKLQLPESKLPYGYESLPTDVENLNDRVSVIEEEFPNKAEYSIEKGVNLYNKEATDFEDNKMITNLGTLLTSNGSRVSPLIEVEPNTLYAICRGVRRAGLYLRFVAEDRSTPLRALNPTDDTEINYSAPEILGNTSGNLILKSPATAKYVQFTVIYVSSTSTTTDITSTAQVIKSDELPTEYYPYLEREIIPMNHLPKEVEDMVNSDINVVDEIIENGQNPVKGSAIYDAIVAANPLWEKTIRYDGDSIGAGGTLTVLKGWSKLIGDRNKNTWSSMAVGGGTITSGTYAKRAWTNGSTTLFTKKEIFTKCYTNSDCTEGEQTIESQSFNSYIVVGGVTYNFNQQESTQRHWICEGIDTLISQGMTADYIVFEGGTNDEVLGDFTNENNLPERFGVFSATDYSGNYDKTTFCGALDYLFYKAATEYPYAKFGFIIAQKMGTGSAARNRRAIFSYVIRSCEKWGIPYINLWDGSFLNPSLLAQCDPSQTVEQNIADGKLYTDSQHLTAYGYNAVTSKIEHWMKGL